MKTAACITLAAVASVATVCSGLADTYYPYQSYEEYHKKYSSPEPPPPQPPPPQPQPPREEKPPVRPEEPMTLTQPPEFLFPKKLGFGVAIGIPYDLFFHDKAYYLLKGGTWYRSHSYKGPWRVHGFSRVPSELRKHDLKVVREERNREFQRFWNNRDNYQGRYFRPAEEESKTPPPPQLKKER